ncbi:hypothetical protein fnug_16 [Pseudomonas phage fnug]|uniref:Uncharacterized protein n=1 Tax=Pseudomonas phage fnug TaxID=2719836 RepID=A0A6H2A8B4_9CAUD|nr:hypothetical protein fnug_16 [Pseudomonas phage fnug]
MYSTKPKCKKEITMKQYREPTTRLTKEKLEWVIERRKERKAESPFGRAHFPAGTRAIFESCSLRFLDENERVYPGQRYETFEATVLGIVANGHDSYVAVLDKPCNLIEGRKYSINISWCKKILERGEGNFTWFKEEPTEYDRAHGWNIREKHPTVRWVEGPRPTKVRNLTWAEEFDYHRHTDPVYVEINKHHNQYFITDMRTFVMFALQEHPAYTNPSKDHLYDLEKLVAAMYADPTIKAAEVKLSRYFGSWLISKKKFHKVLQRLLPFYKTSRRKAQEEDNKAMSEMYEKEMEHDFDEMYGESSDSSDESCYSMEDSYYDSGLDDDIEMTDMYEDSACSREISDDVQPKTIGELLREAMGNPEEEKSKLVIGSMETLSKAVIIK